jgi:uncharacterized SAM-binding protein YcdF (DUF218 family)
LEGYANLFIFENATKGADAILVLGGRNETRVDKAIELLKDGYSSQIYLTSPIDIADKYSFIQTQREIGEMILEYHNIPIQKIPYREKPAASTKDEVLDFCEYQKTQGWERVIVVTDQFHTRRAYFAFWKYSEAIHNHKSFVYRNSDNLFGLGLRETVDWSMDTEEKKKYIAENYIPISEANLSDEVLKEYELEIELGTPLYIHKSYLGSLYPYVVSTQDIYFPSYFYKNDLKIYQVVDNEIVFKNDISGGENSDYGYQRGIIFTYDNRNYAIYFLGGEFYLGEINN